MDFKQKMDLFLDKYTEIYKFSGIIRVTHKEKVIYERAIGYADIENRIPINNGTRFTLYSLSKPFCAIGLLLLADKGLISLDDSPARYLPYAENIDPRITLRHLLHHSSGLKDFNQEAEKLKEFENFELDLPKAIEYLTGLELNFEPGMATRYSNINFCIPALIIENITGLSYEEYMTENVFKPLGMFNTFVDKRGKHTENRAIGYTIDGERIIKCDRGAIGGLFGAGDIISEIGDVYCLNKAIKNKLLLKESTWKEILTPDTISNFGMGCKVTKWHGKNRIIHNGGHIGFRTLHVQLPDDDFDIIILSNFGFGNSRNTISEAVYTAFYGDDGSIADHEAMDAGYIGEIADIKTKGFLPHKNPRITLAKEYEDKILGEYEENTTLTKTDDFYCITENGKRKLYCYPAEKDLFLNEYIDEAYKLNISDNGEIALMGKKKI